MLWSATTLRFKGTLLQVEYMVMTVDETAKTIRLSTRAQELLKKLQQPEINHEPNLKSLWRPEYGSYMVEGTPGLTTLLMLHTLDNHDSCHSGHPYGGKIEDFNEVEKNMKLRRQEVEQMLHDDEILVSMSIFPRLGCFPTFTQPPSYPGTLCPERSCSYSETRHCRPREQLHQVLVLAQRRHVPRSSSFQGSNQKYPDETGRKGLDDMRLIDRRKPV